MTVHPAERFEAPGHIATGSSLAALLDRNLVRLLGASIAEVCDGFDRRRFARQANAALDGLGLTDRAAHIARCWGDQLLPDPSRRLAVVTASLGPLLTVTEGYGLKPFFYMPHGQLIAQTMIAAEGGAEPLSPELLANGLAACRELTMRFTAEFCIRPLIERNQAETLATLQGWLADPNPHVRRLISEGTRPRLPWAGRLRGLQADPEPVIPILTALVCDDERYVRRSVANHLGDIAKDHLERALDLAEGWLNGSLAIGDWNTERAHEVLRHGLRHPAKQGHPRALALRERAGGKTRARRT